VDESPWARRVVRNTSKPVRGTKSEEAEGAWSAGNAFEERILATEIAEAETVEQRLLRAAKAKRHSHWQSLSEPSLVDTSGLSRHIEVASLAALDVARSDTGWLSGAQRGPQS
jgi:hypothetical protein